MEKWLPCFSGDIWLHLPAWWTRPFKAIYSLPKGCHLELARGNWIMETGNQYFPWNDRNNLRTREIYCNKDMWKLHGSIIIRHKYDLIRFPDDPLDAAQAMRRVESIAGFPSVVGAIDGSHITIKALQVNREDYFNGKQNYSINLQGVVDAADKFIDVSTGWPGSIHDARISRLSTLYLRAGNNLIWLSQWNALME